MNSLTFKISFKKKSFQLKYFLLCMPTVEKENVLAVQSFYQLNTAIVTKYAAQSYTCYTA